MARVATIIDHALDAFGDAWDVREKRRTDFGWSVLFGWPIGHRGYGCGGPRVIITEPLADYLRATRHRDVRLPIGRTTLRRLRRVLGLHWWDDRRAWWESRTDELASLTGAEFAQKYGLSEAQVSNVHASVFGRRVRHNGWWRQGEAADLLAGDSPRAYVADRLGISIGSVGRLRWVLRNMTYTLYADGAYFPGDLHGGWAFILCLAGSELIRRSGRIVTTNPAECEAEALRQGLAARPNPGRKTSVVADISRRAGERYLSLPECVTEWTKVRKGESVLHGECHRLARAAAK